MEFCLSLHQTDRDIVQISADPSLAHFSSKSVKDTGAGYPTRGRMGTKSFSPYQKRSKEAYTFLLRTSLRLSGYKETAFQPPCYPSAYPRSGTDLTQYVLNHPQPIADPHASCAKTTAAHEASGLTKQSNVTPASSPAHLQSPPRPVLRPIQLPLHVPLLPPFPGRPGTPLFRQLSVHVRPMPSHPVTLLFCRHLRHRPPRAV